MGQPWVNPWLTHGLTQWSTMGQPGVNPWVNPWLTHGQPHFVFQGGCSKTVFGVLLRFASKQHVRTKRVFT